MDDSIQVYKSVTTLDNNNINKLKSICRENTCYEAAVFSIKPGFQAPNIEEKRKQCLQALSGPVYWEEDCQFNNIEDILIPYDYEERKKKFPKIFKKLEKYIKIFRPDK